MINPNEMQYVDNTFLFGVVVLLLLLLILELVGIPVCYLIGLIRAFKWYCNRKGVC